MRELEEHPIVLYDGVCNLCTGVVKFTLARDPQGVLRYAALQSETGRELLAKWGMNSGPLDSFLFIERGKPYVRSAAALRLARYLPGGWPLLRVLLAVPRPIRDAAYRWIAANRYKWFGRNEQCMLMRPEYIERFLP